MRMDKYKDSNLKEKDVDEEQVLTDEIDNTEETLSRTNRNQEIYRDDYDDAVKILDSSELSSLFSQNKDDLQLTDKNKKEQIYVPKDYNIDNFIAKAHDGKENDNIIRSLDTNNQVDVIKKKEDEISKLVDSIQEKDVLDDDDDLFGDLMPDEDDDEKTVITDPIDESKLESVIGDDTFVDFAVKKQEEIEKNNVFKDIDKIEDVNSKKTPIIILIGSIILLIIIAIVIFVLK